MNRVEIERTTDTQASCEAFFYSLFIEYQESHAREFYDCVGFQGRLKEMSKENEALGCLAREECAESMTQAIVLPILCLYLCSL